MTETELMYRSPTGESIGRGGGVEAPTPTISDLVDDSGHLRNRTRVLVDDSQRLHRLVDEHHGDTLEAEMLTVANRRAKESLASLLDELNNLGFSWRDVARVAGVSVPAVRKWRLGGAASGSNRQKVATVIALCDIASDRYLIADVAGWLETPLHPEAPITGLDMAAKSRFDLVLRLASEYGGDTEEALDEFEPDWRERYSSPVEVFTAPDGMPGLRLAERRS